MDQRTRMSRYYKYSEYLKKTYGEKVYKLPIKLDLTCPNRDGKIAMGGCVFCVEAEGGSFENLSSKLGIKEQLEKNKAHIKKNYNAHKFIAYFQNYSNTYFPIETFESVISEACIEDVVQIDLSTRPDCITKEHLDILKRIEREYNIDICLEIGLQTANYHTLKILNRGHGLSDFIRAAQMIKAYGFRLAVHVILAMPWDDELDTIETAKLLSVLDVNECKIHSLYIPKNTKLQEMYEQKVFELKTMEQYIDAVVLFLRTLKKDIAIQRLIGRMPAENTVFCNWGTSHWKIQDYILEKMERGNYFQGDKCTYLKGIKITR